MTPDAAESVQIEASWKEVLRESFVQPYFQALKVFLRSEKQSGQLIYPPGSLIFNAFNSTPFDKVKVVILGQDPYHGAGQAHGLCFSVPVGTPPPPSLQNIFKELKEDTGFVPPGHGCLQSWADQGVLLLNALLTVRAGQPLSHQNKGWESFTDAAIAALNEKREGIVFMLWGAYAKNKGNIIDRNRHHVLTAAHPSPLSAYNGFFGCRHFSSANQLLEAQGLTPITWQLPPA